MTTKWTYRLFLTILFGGMLLWLIDYFRSHPENLPWTALDLRDPPGMFTAQKIARLTGDTGLCLSLLDEADIEYRALPAREGQDTQCGYSDAVSLGGEAALQSIAYRPAATPLSCPVAAGLALWEREGLQPAAMRLFGQPVVAIDHYGSFACRRVNGSEAGRWSEHATADAIDIAAFELADGSRITVAENWEGTGAQSAFLGEARDAACGLFATVLSPDYNQAHADHFHLDQAERGATGRALCR